VIGSGYNRSISFNFAKSGAKVEDLPAQATSLVAAMKRELGSMYADKWKVVTVYIGGNNLCDVCEEGGLTANSKSRASRAQHRHADTQTAEMVVNANSLASPHPALHHHLGDHVYKIHMTTALQKLATMPKVVINIMKHLDCEIVPLEATPFPPSMCA